MVPQNIEIRDLERGKSSFEGLGILRSDISPVAIPCPSIFRDYRFGLSVRHHKEAGSSELILPRGPDRFEEGFDIPDVNNP